jgi:undecaprenyl diphosphate synthase
MEAGRGRRITELTKSMTSPKTESLMPNAANGRIARPELAPLTEEEQVLRAAIDPDKVPEHIAIIMDGNGRWAQNQGFMDRIRGHEAGSQSVRFAVRACGELGVKALTLYAFSVENWSRPRHEVGALMELLQNFLVQEADEIRDKNVRVLVSGRVDDLPDAARQTLKQTVSESANNTGLVLNLALSYGGRTEILDAVKRIAAEARSGSLDPESLTEADIAARLYHPELPDPDLLIRTSGEMRVSNFLLWQIAYTEIYVSPVLWPDFRRKDLYEAILNFQQRERRFGKVMPA